MRLTIVRQEPASITVVNSIEERVKWARDRMKLSQVSLAASAGVSPGTIGNLEAGTRKNPRELLAIAAALGVNPEWLKSGKGPRDAGIRDEPAASGMRNVRTVWVVGAGQGGIPDRVWTDGDHPVGATDSYTETATTDDHAFVTRVVGDSMAPRYMPGEYALVEPGTPPELEDDVLVRLTTGETMIKRLVSRRGGIRLGSYNTSQVMNFREDEVTWMYYVAHPIPARRILHRVDIEHRDAGPTIYPDMAHPAEGFGGGISTNFGDLTEQPAERSGKAPK